jgi:hypothetical protein
MKHLEENLQIVCVRWFKLQYASKGYLIHHSPNGGKRNAREGARFKAMGVLAGFPDLIIIAKNKVFFIEMKSDKGKLTDNQENVHDALRNNGLFVYTVNDFDSFMSICKAELE